MTPKDEHCYLAPDQLRIGVFVILDLPWLAHSFTLSSFKIRTEAQLQELRALKLARYRYDPDRSDAPAELFPLTGPALDAAPVETVAEAAEVAVASDDPVQQEKQQRIARIAARREQMANVERAFAKAATVMRHLNRNLLVQPRETLEELEVLVGQMVAAFLESPEATLHVMGDKAGGEDVYHHSLNVCILAMMLAKEMGLTVDAAREMGVGALIHDIGLMEIPDRVLKKNPSEYTSAERNLRQQHVQFGVNIGRKAGLSSQALVVIAQHHELADGSGYPMGMRAELMTPGARLVSMVNYYDGLCNPVDINKALTPHEALSFMFAQRRSKFDANALQLMIRSLGVYPPGSIVQLSNDGLAVVTSVNPKKPLRPWILVYDPGIPKEEAIMLNLELEPEINIAKAIRPGLLPPRIAAYLNPRKRVTYFFDAGEGSATGASQ